MLQLRTNYEIDNTVSREYKVFNDNIYGKTWLQNIGRITKGMHDMALMPLAYNNISYRDITIGVDNAEEFEAYNPEINALFENLGQDTYGYVRVYTPEVETIFNQIDSDIFINVPEAVQGLYDKAMTQASLRDVRTPEPITKVKIARTKHLVVLVSNYPNDPQMSDHFLTIGLIPVLFPDWKERFNEKEIEYFKALVNRSQVKRISNVKVTEVFNDIMNSQKYLDKLTEMRTQTAINNVVQSRIRQARATVSNAEASARNYLDNYNKTLNSYYEAQKTLNHLEECKEELKDEIKLAINLEGIVGIRSSGSQFVVCIDVPLQFFDTEEAECVIKNIQREWIKKMFTDLFIEQKYTMHIYTEFYFNFEQGANYYKPEQISYAELNKQNALFNPHTFFYSCLGNYLPKLIEAQAKQDFLMHNNIALASAKSINFRDGAVTNKWIEWFENNIVTPFQSNYYNVDCGNIKCLEDENGNRYSIKELYFTGPEEAPVIEPVDL